MYVLTYNYHYWACRDIYKSVRRTCVITVNSSRGGLITPLTLIFINSAANNEALVLSRMKLSGQPNWNSQIKRQLVQALLLLCQLRFNTFIDF